VSDVAGDEPGPTDTTVDTYYGYVDAVVAALDSSANSG
jgi:hypothetical protein